MKTTFEEKLALIGAMTPVLAELNRFGEMLSQMNIEARLELQKLIDAGVEGADARLSLEAEIRKQENDLSSRMHFMSIVVWEVIDSICEERGFVHYKEE